jgi:hypothetical protein
MLNIIQRFTESQGWKFGRLDGNTNVASRQRLVDRFNSDDSYFGMLMTTRTGGVGLNLTGANRIVLYDPDVSLSSLVVVLEVYSIRSYIRLFIFYAWPVESTDGCSSSGARLAIWTGAGSHHLSTHFGWHGGRKDLSAPDLQDGSF